MNSQYYFPIQCSYEGHEEEVAIFLILDEKKQRIDRWLCNLCMADGNNKNSETVIEIKRVQQYQQTDPEYLQVEDRVESKLPLNKKIKQRCIESVKAYKNSFSDQQNHLDEYFISLRSDIQAKISEAKAKGKKYWDQILSAVFQLKLQYSSIIDCTDLKKIVETHQNENDLNKYTSEFIKQKLDSPKHNDTLNKLNYNLRMVLSQYTTEYFNEHNQILDFQAKKISYNATYQKLDERSKSINGPNKANLSVFTQYIDSSSSSSSQSSFTITDCIDSSQILIPSSSSNCSKAISTFSLNTNAYYQIIFQIEIGNQNSFYSDASQFILLGVVPKSENVIEPNGIQNCIAISGQKREQGCSVVQYGEDLSTLKYQRYDLVMNVCIERNVFYFSNKDKVSRNVLPNCAAFNQNEPVQLFVAAQGDSIKITLVKIEQKNK